MLVLDCEFLLTRWHTVCSLPLATLLKKIGFPGWPDPNLDWVSGFGGSVLTKRGLAPAPFFIAGPDIASVFSLLLPRVAPVLTR